ncbi:MAG: DNA polymerase domain-containing protein, partial [Nitrososphaerales archaeon]
NRILSDTYSKKLSPWNSIYKKTTKNDFGNVDFDYEIVGIASLDLLDLYKKFNPGNKESYTLEFISQLELGVGKLDHSEFDTFREFYEKDYNKFLDYNVQDCYRVFEINKKKQLIELCLFIAYLAKINYEDVYSQIRTWDSIIYNHLKSKNIVIPKKSTSSKNEKFEGAYVKEPIPGLYDWVVSFDATSLYPSIIQSWNISPETFVGMTKEYITVDGLLNKQYTNLSDEYCTAANGALYLKDKRGLFPELVDLYMEKRRSAKNTMLKYKAELEDHKRLKTLTPEINKDLIDKISKYSIEEQAIKVNLNSLYGSLGNAYFRYFKLENAIAVTLTGQYIIKSVGDGINNDLNKMFGLENFDWAFYNDTDSVVGDSIIYIDGNPITISQFYDSISENYIKCDTFNDNYVKIVSNGSKSLSLSSGKVLENKPIKYVMKHKVKKEIFRITDTKGNAVIVTEDHSIIVEDKRSIELTSIKPKELNSKIHRIINICKTDVLSEYFSIEFNEGFTVESLGIVKDWVYDIEVEDNHNFFANNILVHNSAYITLKPLVDKYYKDIPQENLVDILDKICKDKLTPMINKHCTDLQNYTNAARHMISFKREAISTRGIFVKKKKYFLNVLDNEGVRYAKPELKVMGLQVVQSSTPSKIRFMLKEALPLMLEADENTLQNYISKVKDEYYKLNINDIAFPRGVQGLAKYYDPKTIYGFKCPIHVKGSLLYNKLIVDGKLLNKYPKINEGDKIKFTYLKLPNPLKDEVIAFISELPEEFKLNEYVDYNKQFEKSFLDPISNILDIIGWSAEKRFTLDDFY